MVADEVDFLGTEAAWCEREALMPQTTEDEALALLERARGYRAQQEQVLSLHGIDRAAMDAERPPARTKMVNRLELLTFVALLYVPIILASLCLIFRRIVGVQ